MIENAYYLEWEYLYRSNKFNITDKGDLKENIGSGLIERDQNYKIFVTLKGTGTPLWPDEDDKNEYRKGEQISPPKDILGVTDHNSEITINRFLPMNINVRGTGDSTITGKCIQVRKKINYNEESRHLIDWISNYSIFPLGMHSRTTKRVISSTYNRERGNQHIDTINDRNINSSQDCIRIESKINGQNFEAFIGEVHKHFDVSEINPGFVEYQEYDSSNLNEDHRRSIILGLSFIFGRELGWVGSTKYSNEWNPIEYLAQSMFLAGGVEALEKLNMPPAPLFLDNAKSQLFPDENKINRLLNSFLSNLDPLNLNHPIWLAWEANVAPLDNQATLLGAAIESIRTSFWESQEGKPGSLLIETSQWKKIKEQLLDAYSEAISGYEPKNDEHNIVRRKIEQLNQKSSNMQYDDFFYEINLPIDEVEKKALRERNRPAHGYRYSPEQYKSLNSNVRALRTLLNRIILKLIGGSDHYYDYSTYGFPIRSIDDPLGGPEGEGTPAN